MHKDSDLQLTSHVLRCMEAWEATQPVCPIWSDGNLQKVAHHSATMLQQNWGKENWLKIGKTALLRNNGILLGISWITETMSCIIKLIWLLGQNSRFWIGKWARYTTNYV